MRKVKIQDVNVHPELSNLSVTEEQIKRMSFLLEEFGLFQPILVTRVGSNFFVVDGIIRLEAAKKLNWEEIGVQEVDWQPIDVIEKRCISNVSIKKSHWNLAIEIHMFMNTLVGKRRGKKRELKDFIKYFSNCDESKMNGIIGDVSLMAIEVFGLPFGKSTLRMFNRLFEKHLDASQEFLDLKLFEKLDAEEISINRAFEIMTDFFTTKSNQGKNAITEVIEYSKNPINGDSNHRVFVNSNEDLSFLTDDSISTVITSPPYFGKQAKYSEAENNFFGILHGNEKTVDEYIKKEVEVYRGLKSKLKKDGSLFVVIGDAFRGEDNCIPERLVVAMLNDGWHCPSRMLWAKANQKPQKVSGRLQPVGEHVLHFTLDKNHKWKEFLNWVDKPVKLGRTTGEDYVDGVKRPGYYVKRPYERFRTFIEEQKFIGVLKHNCFNVEEVKEFGKPNHPCPLPLNLAIFLTMLSTDKFDTVCDIYGGIGTVSHAAKVLYRNSISIDIDPISSNFAVNRIESCDHHIFTNEELEVVEGLFVSPKLRKVKTAA